MSTDCPIGLDDLVEYVLGETPEAKVEPLEDHLFGCERCARRLDSLDRIRRAVSAAVLRSALGGSVNGAFVDRASRDGLSLREYRIAEGTTVACSAGPEDLVVVRLAAGFEGVGDLRLDGTFEDLERGESEPLPTRDAVVDRDLGEVVLVFPGEVVRAYPRSRWTLRLQGETATGRAEMGPFVMDHTPWDRGERARL